MVQFIGGLSPHTGSYNIRRAIVDAYELLPSLHPWTYFQRKHRVTLQEPQTDGTIEYTSSTRALVLSDATWPSWAKYGEVLIGDVLSRIASVDSSTQVTLEPDNAPAADIASGTAYELQRSSYPLSPDIRRVSSPIGEDKWTDRYVRPDEWLTLRQGSPSSGEPFHWTIMGSPDSYGLLSLIFYPAPSAAESMDLLVEARPRPLRYDGTQNDQRVGTVTSTATDETVTGSGTAFDDSMVGSILRFGTTTKYPTQRIGMNPYTEEAVIESVTSATSLELAAAAAVTRSSGVKYTISDPIDMDRSLRPLFLRLCEKMLAQFLGDAKRYQVATLAADEALGEARSTNSRVNDISVVGGDIPYQRRMADMPYLPNG
jgi:hypothetical protein